MTLFRETCPHCGQSMKGMLFGVYFSPGRYRVLMAIFDNPGITLERLRIKLYPNGNWRVILSTITAINSILEQTHYKVIGPGRGNKGEGYYVSRRIETADFYPVNKMQRIEERK
jgi:hypothetical protein